MSIFRMVKHKTIDQVFFWIKILQAIQTTLLQKMVFANVQLEASSNKEEKKRKKLVQIWWIWFRANVDLDSQHNALDYVDLEQKKNKTFFLNELHISW